MHGLSNTRQKEEEKQREDDERQKEENKQKESCISVLYEMKRWVLQVKIELPLVLRS